MAKKDNRYYSTAYFLCRNQLSFESGCVMRGHKVVIPEKLSLPLLSELHKSHVGIVKTKAEVRSRFWFLGEDDAVEKMIGLVMYAYN